MASLLNQIICLAGCGDSKTGGRALKTPKGQLPISTKRSQITILGVSLNFLAVILMIRGKSGLA
jgi:hypothetical protein